MTYRYHYRVFGLKVSSEYELPELEVNDSSEQPDVWIRDAETPQQLEGALVYGNQLQVVKESLLLKVNVAGNFWIRNGNEIIIKPLPEAPPENVRLFLLGSAFGAILHQRGILPLHGSGLVYDGKAFVLTGNTGAGKSTLAAALVRKGCKLLTDDVAAVTFDVSGTSWLQPAYPQQKLWQDSASSLGLIPGRLIRVMADQEKYAVPVETVYQKEAVQLVGIFQINKPINQGDNDLKLETVGIMDKLNLLIRNTYRQRYIQGLGMRESHFQNCAKLASNIRAARIFRAQGFDRLDELAEIVLEHLKVD